MAQNRTTVELLMNNVRTMYFFHRHTELLCQSQKQKQSLEDQLMSITQQCENRLSAEFKELEQKYTNQLRHYEERLMLQTQKYESELR